MLEKIKKKCVSLSRGHCFVEFANNGGMSVKSTTANLLETTKEVLLKINAERVVCPCADTPLQCIVM